MSWATDSPGMLAGQMPASHDKEEESPQYPRPPGSRKRIVVVGLGMVGIAFIEKMLKLDSKRREYDIVVIGEEAHLAYNRVGLTSFFQHRKVENLYLNQKEWVGERKNYRFPFCEGDGRNWSRTANIAALHVV